MLAVNSQWLVTRTLAGGKTLTSSVTRFVYALGKPALSRRVVYLPPAKASQINQERKHRGTHKTDRRE